MLQWLSKSSLVLLAISDTDWVADKSPNDFKTPGSPFRSISETAPLSAIQTTETGRVSLVCYILAHVNADASSRYIPVQMGMDFRYNEFLLQRAMVRKLQISNQKLLDVARGLLMQTLNLVEQAPKIGRFVCDVPWIVREQSSCDLLGTLLIHPKIAKYGLPTAGVLGLELLRQSRTKPRSATAVPLSLPRSEVIQNLSNIVAQVKSSVQPEDGNYALCLQARKVIQRILDQVLQPESYAASDAPRGQLLTADISADKTADQQDWLSTRSELDFWSTLPTHPLLSSSRARAT